MLSSSTQNCIEPIFFTIRGILTEVNASRGARAIRRLWPTRKDAAGTNAQASDNQLTQTPCDAPDGFTASTEYFMQIGSITRLFAH